MASVNVWHLALLKRAAGFLAGCDSGAAMSVSHQSLLTRWRQVLISGGSPAGAVLFDIVEKRKGCAGGGAVFGIVNAHQVGITKSIPNDLS